MVEATYLPRLQGLPEAERTLQRVHRGETWTPRKAIRRAVWHELYHLNRSAGW